MEENLDGTSTRRKPTAWCTDNAAFHLPASVSAGDGCSPSRRARQAVNATASLTLVLDRCKISYAAAAEAVVARDRIPSPCGA
jgi:hypothetical protein